MFTTESTESIEDGENGLNRISRAVIGAAIEVHRQLGTPIDCLYRLDLVVGGLVVVEVKAVENLLPVHQAQILSYLKLSGLPLGLLINFHGATLKEGVRRFRSL